MGGRGDGQARPHLSRRGEYFVDPSEEILPASCGQPSDGGYVPNTAPILWEQGRNELSKLADVAGIDSLPPEVRGWLERSAANA